MNSSIGISLEDLGVSKDDLVTADDREKLQKLLENVRLATVKAVVDREIDEAEAIFGIVLNVIRQLKGVSVSDAIAMLSGRPASEQPREVTSSQPAAEASQPTRPRRSGDEDNDLSDQLARANTAKREADTAKRTAEQELQKVLTAIGQALDGVNIPLVDGKVTSNIKDMITTELAKAEQQGRNNAIGDGNVAKAEVKAKADEALDKVKAVKQSPMKGGASSKAEAEAAIRAVIDLAS